MPEVQDFLCKYCHCNIFGSSQVTTTY